MVTWMQRRIVIAAISVQSLNCLWPCVSVAQNQSRPVVGFLNNQSPDRWQRLIQAFEGGLNERQLPSKKKAEIIYRWAYGHNDRLPGLVQEFLDKRVDVIVATGGADPAFAARKLTSAFPVVFVMGPNPVEVGLVKSLARPGGNLTGFTLFTLELIPKRLELLKEMIPAGSVVAAVFNANNSSSLNQFGTLEAAAKSSSLKIRMYSFDTKKSLQELFASIGSSNTRAIFIGSDSEFFANRRMIVRLVANLKLPAIYESRDYVEAGGLISYGVDYADVYRRAGNTAARILSGDKPAELPIQQPTKFQLAINLGTARSMNVGVPPPLVARADEVIE